MKKILKWFLVVLLALIIPILIWTLYNNRDRHPDYEMNLSIQQDATNVQYQAGFAKKMITPTVIILNVFYIVAWEVGVPALINRMVMIERGMLSIAEACIKLRLARFIFG